MKSLFVLAVICLLFNLGQPRRWSAFQEFFDETGCVDTAEPEECKDVLDNNRCYYESASETCAKTCNYCGKGCKDVKSARLCDLYLKKNLCEKRSQAYDNCRAKCSLCQK